MGLVNIGCCSKFLMHISLSLSLGYFWAFINIREWAVQALPIQHLLDHGHCFHVCMSFFRVEVIGRARERMPQLLVYMVSSTEIVTTYLLHDCGFGFTTIEMRLFPFSSATLTLQRICNGFPSRRFTCAE